MVCIESISVYEKWYIPSELMCADDLVFTTPRMEPLARRFAEEKVSLLTKDRRWMQDSIIVGSSDGKIIVNSGEWPRGKEHKQTLLSAQYV